MERRHHGDDAEPAQQVREELKTRRSWRFRYRQQMLLDELADAGFRVQSDFDFFYLPMDHSRAMKLLAELGSEAMRRI